MYIFIRFGDSPVLGKESEDLVLVMSPSTHGPWQASGTHRARGESFRTLPMTLATINWRCQSLAKSRQQWSSTGAAMDPELIKEFYGKQPNATIQCL